MWIRLLGAIVLGLLLYVGAVFMFDNIITGTSQVAVITKQVVPISIACVVVGILGMGIFTKHT